MTDLSPESQEAAAQALCERFGREPNEHDRRDAERAIRGFLTAERAQGRAMMPRDPDNMVDLCEIGRAAA